MKTYTQFVIESLELNLTKLQKHVTETEPTTGNVVKMHDMIRNIAKQHNISSSKLYSNIINNNSAHDKYKQAATLDEFVEKIDEAKGSFRAGYNKAKNKFFNINKETNEETNLDLELILSEFKAGQDIGKPNTGPDTGFKNLEKKLTPKYGKESAKKIAGSVLQKILHKK